MIPLCLGIGHLGVQPEHLLVDSVHGAGDLPGDGADRVAVSAHIDRPERGFLKAASVVGDVQGHAQTVHAVRTDVARLLFVPGR